MEKLRGVRWGFLTLVFVFLAACSGGGGGDDGGIEGTGFKERLSGTAAVGKPIANADVTVKDSKGKKKTAKTDANGKYDIDVSDLTGPFLLKVKADEKRELFAAAETHGVANVTPLSDVSCRNWFETRGRHVDDEFEGDAEIQNPPRESELALIRDALRALLRLAYAKFGVDETFDFDRSPFDADGNNFDSLLDNLTVTFDKNKITILLRDPITGLQAIIVISFDLSEDLAKPDGTAPTVPTGLAVVPAGESSLVVVWNSSSDNVGVAGYNVYRDGNKIATTPYPVFSDTGLSTSTQYCYAVEAFDGANILGPKTDAVCATTLAVADTTAPTTPQNVGATPAGTGTVALAWLPSPEDDVLGYDIVRGPLGDANTKVATTVASGFTDLNLSAGTQYCYRLRAFDAALNRSDYTDEICATTQPDNPPSDTAPPTSSASPMGGAFSSAQIVTLNCVDTGGSGCGPIYYSVDGSTPTTLSSVYVQPLVIGSTATLRFFAVDRAGNVETSIHAETYTIGAGNSDADAPINTTGVDFIDGGAPNTSSTSVLLTLSATDNVAVVAYCAQDNATGTTPTPEAGCWTNVTPAAGYTGVITHNFANAYVPGNIAHVFVRFKDAAGNISGANTDSISIASATDGTSPINTTGVEFINSGATETSSLSVSLALAATDNVGVTAYFVSGGIGQAFPAVQPAPGAAGWIPVAASTSYNAPVNYTFALSATNGDVLTAHVWFKDAGDSVSQVASDSIVYVSAAKPPVLVDDFSSGWGNWSAEGQWEIGTPTVGPATCYSGNQCAGTVLGGNYADTDTSFITPAMVLPAVDAGEEIQLRFWHWHSFATNANGNDTGRIYIQEEASAGVWSTTLVELAQFYGSSGGVWTQPMVDLSAFAGKKVRVHFRLVNNYWSGVSTGWYIDDVTVAAVTSDKTTPYTASFESGLSDWWASNGQWQIGAPTAGPTGCYSGTQCAGTVIGGNYVDTDTSLVTPSITLPALGTGEELQLRFWEWHSFATNANGNDTGRVYIQEQTAPGAWSALVELSQFYGSSGAVWTRSTVDLSAYAGKKVRVHFRLVNNYWSGASSGWFIDDVSVAAVPISQSIPLSFDFESGLGNWWSSNGQWQIGTPSAGPTACHSGTRCAGTVLGGNYVDTDSSLVTPSIILPTLGTGESLELRYWTWYSFATNANGNDTGRVYIQEETAPGVWGSLVEVSAPPYHYGSSAGVWSPPNVTLTSYSGKKVRIHFRLVNNYWSGTSTGWYIDDVSVIKY